NTVRPCCRGDRGRLRALLFSGERPVTAAATVDGTSLVPGSIANARSGSFADAFFFSIETLATVGYGEMYPATPYGRVVAATEIVCGLGFTAILTGLTFVRFS